MKKSFWLALFLIVAIVGQSVGGFALSGDPVYVTGIDADTIDSMAIDPQEWVLQRDMGWKDFEPNPVVDWMDEHNPAGMFNPTGASFGEQEKIIGGLVLVDYLDRPFISGQPRGTDVLGYLMFDEETGDYDMDQGVVKNPVVSVLDFPEKYTQGYQDLPKFWSDYLNDPDFKVTNHGSTIDGYYRESTYGKWAVDIQAYGVYTLPFFEFELMGTYLGEGNFNSFRDIPPSFRYGNPTQASVSSSGTGNGRASGLDGHSREVSKQGRADYPGNLYNLPEGIRGLNRSEPTKYSNFDFFFNLHAGYCTSGSWQPFGVMQFATRQDVTTHLTPGYQEGLVDDLGPMGRLKKVEAFFNTYPEWVPVYAERYVSGWANNTGVWNAARYNANDPDAVARIAEYRETRFWIEILAEYNRCVSEDKLNEFVFKLPKEDYDWADYYHKTTDYVGNAHAKNTRYVSFTSWEGSVGEWSHAQLPPGTSGGNSWGQTGAGKSLPYSTQGENSGVGTFAHEFGHVAGWPDNYGSPWADSRSAGTENWDIMSRGSFGGPYGDLARWAVPGVEGGTVPMVPTFGLKSRGAGPDSSRLNSFYDSGDVKIVSNQALASGTPVVAEIVSSVIPLNTQYNDFGVPRFDPETGKGFYKALRVDFGTGDWADKATLVSNATSNGTAGGGLAAYRTRALQTAVEVVDRAGFTSYAHDSGVLISRVSNLSNGAREVVDSHLYDIDMVDYFSNVKNPHVREGDWTRYVVAHATQQADVLFKAGKSYTDTGYYGSVRDVEPGNNRRSFPTTYTPGFQDGLGGNGKVVYPGSVKKGESQDGRPIVSGDTVNEWRDEPNKLHYYILSNNMNTVLPHGEPDHYDHGQFLSYSVAVRHDNGLPVGGNLVLEETGTFVPAIVGNYAKQTYTLTNTGDATDIVRISLEGTAADGRFQTIQVPGNGGLPSSVNEAGSNYTYNPNNRDIYIDREVPTFYSEQNAVLLNDLYAVGAGETITVDVYVRTVTGDKEDYDLKIIASSETNPDKADTITIMGELQLNTDAHLVKKGEYFNLYPTFDKQINSNTAVLNFTFNKNLFDYRGFFPADGVTVLDSKATDSGYSFTVMVDDYETVDYGRVLFSAKEDADLQNEDHEILLTVQYVVKQNNGDKEIWTATASTTFVSTNGKDPFPPPGGEFTLITLSNIIDHFGATPSHALWQEIIRFFDYNNNKVIDISDIVTVAQKIVL